MTKTKRDELLEKSVEELQKQSLKTQLAMELSISESVIDMFQNFVNPLDRFFDPDDNQFWLPVGAHHRHGKGTAHGLDHILTETDLIRMRSTVRWLAHENEFAQNALANRVAFTVGTGITYSIQPKKASDNETQAVIDRKQETAMLAQQLIDTFIEDNDWGEYEQELVEREDRDGEWFIRFFPQADGMLQFRTIEPDEVFTPQSMIDRKDIEMGVQCDIEDAQTILGYFVNDEFVDKSEIMHRKCNVDRNVKRGISTLWSVRKNFIRAEKLQRNMSTVASVQAALVAVRKFSNTSAKQAMDFIDRQANLSYNPSVGNFSGGGNVNIKTEARKIDTWHPGTILNMPKGQELDLNVKGLDSSKFIAILQSELRAIAARFVMPEFMISSDASNANFASTMIAETPAVRQFQKKQAIYIKRGKKIMTMVLLNAIDVGLLPPDTMELINIDAHAPSLVVRDIKKETEARETKHNAGILSTQTWAAQEGLDYEQEQRNIQEHNERFGGFEGQPLPLPTDAS